MTLSNQNVIDLATDHLRIGADRLKIEMKSFVSGDLKRVLRFRENCVYILVSAIMWGDQIVELSNNESVVLSGSRYSGCITPLLFNSWNLLEGSFVSMIYYECTVI